MKELLRFVDNWLFGQYDASTESLAIFRMVYAAYVLLGALPGGLWIRHLPNAAFAPPVSLAALFTHFPPYWLMVGLNALTILLDVSLLIGWHTRTASLGIAVGLILVRSFSYADGKIDNDILGVIVPAVLAWSSWGASFSVDALTRRHDPARARARHPWLLALLALMIGLGYLSAGLAKARGGWLSPSTSGTRWWLFNNFFVTGRETPLASLGMKVFPLWLWKLMDVSTVFWETTFVFASVRRRTFLVFCAIGALFHFGVWQLFSITFAVNAIAYGAFVDWTALARGLGFRVPKLEGAVLTAFCCVPLAIGITKLLWLDEGSLEGFARAVEVSVLLVAFAIAGGYLTLRLRRTVV